MSIERQLVMDAETIEQLKQMAGLEGYSRRTPRELDRYRFAQTVLSLGCQAVGTQVQCHDCAGLQLDTPMCQRVNGTITTNE